MNARPTDLGIDENDLRTIALSFIARHLPEETPYFDLLWQYYRTHPSGESAKRLPKNLGLPFARRAKVGTPFVLGTMDLLLEELQKKGFVPDAAATRQAVSAAARAYGAPRSLIPKLLEELVPRLLHEFRTGRLEPSNTEEQLATPADQPPLITLAVLGPPRYTLEERRLTREQATTLAYGEDHDLVVDELRHLCVCWTNGQRAELEFKKIGPLVQGFFWVVLAHVGERFHYSYVQDLLALKRLSLTTVAPRIHQYRRRLAVMLGNGLSPTMPKDGKRRVLAQDRSVAIEAKARLLDRVLTSPVPHEYFVKSDNWSLCWLREHPTIESSVLVAHLRRRLPGTIDPV